MTRLVLLIGTLVGLAAGSVTAQADDASRLQAARDIVVTTHAADNLRVLMPKFMQQMRPMMIAQGANAKQVDDFLAKFGQEFDKQTDRFVDLAAQVYAKEFSDDDLKALLDFYKTPTGQHLLGKQVEIAQAMMVAGQQWGQLMAKQILEDFAKEKAGQQQKL